MNSYGTLLNLQEANALIATTKDGLLAICGDNALLSQLAPGRWVGGSTPYFMSEQGGQVVGTIARDKVLVASLPYHGGKMVPKTYSTSDLKQIAVDAPANGYTFLMLPAFSEVHVEYGQNAPHYQDLFMKPIFGWVTGVHLDQLAIEKPKVYTGSDGRSFSNRAIAVHVELPPNKMAVIDILNIFQEGDGPEIRFPSNGFVAKECTVGGASVNFASWCTQNKVDGKSPLVADYAGAKVNVCIQEIAEARGEVTFYGPLFEGVSYRFAKPVADYSKLFGSMMTSLPPNAPFACNCILNFLYGELEGRPAGMPGPVTFGEIAYQLLNQTMVHFDIVDV